MQRAAILGDALGLYFQRDPVRAADAAGVVYPRDARISPLRIAFLPAPVADGRALVAIIPSASRDEIVEGIATALGHHFLGHRTLDAYLYGPEGPLFGDRVAAGEATSFAQYFLSGRDGLQAGLGQAARR